VVTSKSMLSKMKEVNQGMNRVPLWSYNIWKFIQSVISQLLLSAFRVVLQI